MESSRPEASARWPSSFDGPRQRQLKPRAASSLGPPRPASARLGQLADLFVLARPHRPCYPRRSEAILNQMPGGAFQQKMTRAVTFQVQKIIIKAWRKEWKRSLQEYEEEQNVPQAERIADPDADSQ